MTANDRERDNGGEFQARVTDEDLLDVLCIAESPVLTAQMIADELPVGRQAVYERLQKLHDEESVDRLKVGGRAVVWWEVDSSEQ
ncbi:response regulator of citrate/malate metabolism [Haladaptatus sp. CMAA 1911]|uniref:response regulator of citrate/malate metabolism n=1 Tax=unclassified Haladaptatus TaxID=2622732 RepID=UPI00375518DD